MNASVSTWSVHHLLETGSLTPEGFIDLVFENGIKMIEVVDFDFPNPDFSFMVKFKDKAEKKGITISCMSIEHDLCRLTEEEREADIKKVKDWIVLSENIAVKKVRIFTGRHKPSIPYSMQMEWVYKGISKIAEEAERLDVDLVLENHNDVCLGADEILELFRRINSKKLFTCPDIFNYKIMAAKNKPVIDEWGYREIEKLLPFARNAHLKICEAVDNNRGDKFLDLERVLRQMKAHNYNGPVALEFMWPYILDNQQQYTGLKNAMQVLVYQINRL
ncbi:MAG: sugar phosphate isomerase/epimerase [Prevotella sp.]|jgi:sugar phosphate isomerase/epimerase|nr:sugar phosphate isomerase/epimerase [Prevotella sp.]